MKTRLRRGESGYLISKSSVPSGCPSCKKSMQTEQNISKLFRSRIKNKTIEARIVSLNKIQQG